MMEEQNPSLFVLSQHSASPRHVCGSKSCHTRGRLLRPLSPVGVGWSNCKFWPTMSLPGISGSLADQSGLEVWDFCFVSLRWHLHLQPRLACCPCLSGHRQTLALTGVCGSLVCPLAHERCPPFHPPECQGRQRPSFKLLQTS